MILATLCYVKDTAAEKTLMLHRIKKPNDLHEGKWNGLGGKFNDGESPEDCVIREIKEESGLTITEPVMRGFITFPKFDGSRDWHVFIFTADKFEGDIIESHEGKLEWIDNSRLLDLNLWEGDSVFMKWIEEKKFFSAKFNYEEKKLINYTVNFY